ncbi:MAG: sugar ABC transporter permease [Chloroflexota bacterium]|nr:sugar ABC transporter permease [Chloroflexota bacterium]
MAVPSTDRTGATSSTAIPTRRPGAGSVAPVAGAGALERRRSRVTRRRLSEIGLGYTLLAPAVVLLLVFEVFPILYGAYISTCDWRLQCTQFIGFGNYTRALTDSAVWHALLVTATYALISVPLQLGLGLWIAYLLYQKVRGQEVFRVLFFLPYITSTVASAAVWSYLYSPDNGLLNSALRLVGLPAQHWLTEPRGVLALMGHAIGVDLPLWMQGPSMALVSLIAFTTWVFVGYDIAIFLAGLGNVPTELYDAARVDGASGWGLFRNITFPLLSPTTFFLLIFTVIGTFKAFNHIWVMTEGGPSDATTTASVLIFQQLYQNNRYGYSAALAFILFVVILVLTVVQNRLAGRRVVYD